MRELWITVPTLVHEELGRKGRDDGQVPALVTHIAHKDAAHPRSSARLTTCRGENIIWAPPYATNPKFRHLVVRAGVIGADLDHPGANSQNTPRDRCRIPELEADRACGSAGMCRSERSHGGALISSTLSARPWVEG